MWYSGYRPLAPPFAYGTFTLCGLGFPSPHSARLCSIMPVHNPAQDCSGTVWTLPRSLATTYGITIVFFSCGYLDVSVPRVSPPHTMDSCTVTRAFTPGGFPHSDIRGSKAICASPRLFAAYHVLHRLLAPRHSPCALSSLTFFADHPSGSHTSCMRLRLSKNFAHADFARSL